MAFVKLEKSARHGHYNEKEPAVHMGAHRTATGKTIYFSITSAAIAQVGWSVTATEKRRTVAVHLNEGVGTDAGFLLLSAGDAKHGYVFGSEVGKSHAMCTSITAAKLKHYVLNDDQVPVDTTEFTIDEKDHTILIQCPDWLRYNPQSYEEPEKPKLELVPPKEDKKSARPTVDIIDKRTKGDKLNRQERRTVAAAVARGLR